MVRTLRTWMALVVLTLSGVAIATAETANHSDAENDAKPASAASSTDPGVDKTGTAALLPSSTERLEEQIRVSRLGPSLPGSAPTSPLTDGHENQANGTLPGGLHLWALGLGGVLLMTASWVGARRLGRRPSLAEEAAGTHLIERDAHSAFSSRLETIEQSVLDLVESFDSVARRLRRIELKTEEEIALPAGAWARNNAPVAPPTASPTAPPAASPAGSPAGSLAASPAASPAASTAASPSKSPAEPSETESAPSRRRNLEYDDPDPLFGGVEAAALARFTSSIPLDPSIQTANVSAELPDLVDVSPWEHFVADTSGSELKVAQSPKLVDSEVETPLYETAKARPVEPVAVENTETNPPAATPSRVPSAAKKWVRSRSAGQSTASNGLSPAELSNLARMREQVLNLAAAGIGVKDIGPRVGLGQGEVELILKSLFRDQSEGVPTAESGQVGR